jgi:hypothetical protein
VEAMDCTHAESDMETIMPRLTKYSCRLCGEKWMIWSGTVCRRCQHFIRWDGLPIRPAPKVDETSLVKSAFAYDYCRECDPRREDLRAGRVIEFREGFAFKSPEDGTLYTTEWSAKTWTIYAVNTTTLERQEVLRSR